MAFTTSVPRRKPPSTMTTARPLTARTTSGSTSSDPRPWSSWRPPWLETYTPSTPWSHAMAASSAVAMPFRMSGMSWVSLKRLTWSQESAACHSMPRAAWRHAEGARGLGRGGAASRREALHRADGREHDGQAHGPAHEGRGRVHLGGVAQHARPEGDRVDGRAVPPERGLRLGAADHVIPGPI